MKKQYAALPFRMKQPELIEVLLITTRNKGHWSIPKGWPMPPRSAHGTAEQEAYEEAGLVGRAGARRVGRFRVSKRRGGRKVKCQVDVFPFTVKGHSRSWPEKGQRRKRWFALEDAIDSVNRKSLRSLLASIERRPAALARRGER